MAVDNLVDTVADTVADTEAVADTVCIAKMKLSSHPP